MLRVVQQRGNGAPRWVDHLGAATCATGNFLLCMICPLRRNGELQQRLGLISTGTPGSQSGKKAITSTTGETTVYTETYGPYLGMPCRSYCDLVRVDPIR